jgi:hypothetical protein
LTKTKRAFNILRTTGTKTKYVECSTEQPKRDRNRPRSRTSSAPFPYPSGNGTGSDNEKKSIESTKKEQDNRKVSDNKDDRGKKVVSGDSRGRSANGRNRGRANRFNKRLAAGNPLPTLRWVTELTVSWRTYNDNHRTSTLYNNWYAHLPPVLI